MKIFSYFKLTLFFILGILIGFICCAALFEKAGMEKDQWGDFATWVSAGVSFLALLMAGYAAYLGKKAADISNENTAIISLNELIERRSKGINDMFECLRHKLENCSNSSIVYGPNHEIRASKERMFMRSFPEILDLSDKLKRLFILTEQTINQAQIREDLKIKIQKNLFELVDSKNISEILIRSESENSFRFKPEGFVGSELYYENMRSITSIIIKLNLYGEFVYTARKLGYV